MGLTTAGQSPTTAVADTKTSDDVDVRAQPLGRVRGWLLFVCGVTILIALHALVLVVLNWLAAVLGPVGWVTVIYGIVVGGALFGIWIWTDGSGRLVAIVLAAIASIITRELLLPSWQGPQHVVALGVGILLGVLDVREVEFWRRLHKSQRVMEWPNWWVWRPNVYARLLLIAPILAAVALFGWRYAAHVRHEQLVTSIEQFGGSTSDASPPTWWRHVGTGWSYGQLSRAQIAASELAATEEPGHADSVSHERRDDVSDGLVNDLVRGVGRSTSLETLTISDPNVTDEAFTTYDALHELQDVLINCPNVTDRGLKFLGNQDSLQQLDLSGTPATGKSFAGSTKLAGLLSLVLSETRFNDIAVAKLPPLPELRTLDLRGTPITDAALVHIGQHTSLAVLDLGHTLVTDAGLRHLNGLASLDTLILDGCDVSVDGMSGICQSTNIVTLRAAGTDLSAGDLSRLAGVRRLIVPGATLGNDALAELAQVDTLIQVDLSDTNIRDEHVETLREYPDFGSISLEARALDLQQRRMTINNPPGLRRHPTGTLSLRGTKITDESLAVIGSLEFLVSLDISHTSITDEGVRHLTGMPHVYILNLSETQITNVTLDVLGTLPRLFVLDLTNTHVTDEGVALFMEAHPRVHIDR